MEEAYREDHRAGPITLVTEDIVDASPFISLRFLGAELLIAKEMPVRNCRRCSGESRMYKAGGAEEGAKGSVGGGECSSPARDRETCWWIQ